MDWLWPDLLLLLALVPLAVGLYTWILRRRFAVRYSSLLLVKEAMPPSSWLKRHLPFLLFMIALTSLVLASGRPIMPVQIFSGRTTIMLTLDISRSMCMRDILPTRLDVAKGAVRSFVEHPVLGTQIGLVAFAGFAELAQPPTTDVNMLETAVKDLVTATNTAIGSGILRALDAIAEVDRRVPKSQEIGDSSVYSLETVPVSRSDEEDYVPHIIVLLTDGASNSGPDPLLAAQQAAERGVRIFTIGFGTTKSAVMDCGTTIADNAYLSPGLETPGSGGFGAEPDEVTLKQIAQMTGGKFYSATSAVELQTVFQSLGNYVAMTNQTIEVSVFFAAVGVLMVVTAFILSLIWHPVL